MSAKCPICGKDSVDKFKPFCGKRCADVDLNRWIGEVYAIPVAPEDDEDGDGDDTPQTEEKNCD